jgi:hypothetical protein
MTIAIYMGGFFFVYFGAFIIGYAAGAAVGMVNTSLF